MKLTLCTGKILVSKIFKSNSAKALSDSKTYATILSLTYSRSLSNRIPILSSFSVGIFRVRSLIKLAIGYIFERLENV